MKDQDKDVMKGIVLRCQGPRQRYVGWQVSGDVRDQDKDVMKGCLEMSRTMTKVCCMAGVWRFEGPRQRCDEVVLRCQGPRQRYVEWQVSGDVKDQDKDVMTPNPPKKKLENPS